ncbi:hypothetical protein EYF80_017178 [Liparis tanakae]|uniref:Uncharacterized protein n=1 Tax=Liparis tanakae TaxID=230148 RepID=A0A4Z2I479_9TELE|nr:hypothetical protein EYF80_017178 [Liparis tanakae]
MIEETGTMKGKLSLRNACVAPPPSSPHTGALPHRSARLRLDSRRRVKLSVGGRRGGVAQKRVKGQTLRILNGLRAAAAPFDSLTPMKAAREDKRGRGRRGGADGQKRDTRTARLSLGTMRPHVSNDSSSSSESAFNRHSA